MDRQRQIKDRLNRYRRLDLERRQLEEELERINASTLYPHPQNLSGMPAGGGSGDPMVSAVAKRLAISEKYERILAEILSEREAIENMISGLDVDQRVLVRYRYLIGLTWDDICDRMAYSPRQIHYIHSRALRALAEKEKEDDND